eukprot:1136761_1
MTSKVRKTRTINNSIVDIDNVFIGPGDAYVTWIRIAKQKLWQREFALLRQRCEASDVNILTMIMMFVRNQSELFDKSDLNSYALEIIVTRIYQQQLQWQIMNDNSPLIATYMRYIDDLLGKWNGYHPTKKTIDSFREYFQESRGWLDRNKMTKMAQNLWIPMMRLIEEVSRNAASQTFDPQACRLQNVYADYLQTWLFLGLIEHQIKPDNCAHKWLIPATVYQTFCTEYHPNVAVTYVCNIQSEPHRTASQIQNMNTSKTADIRVCYLRAIGRQIESLKQSFETELSTFYTQQWFETDTSLNASKSGLSEMYHCNEPPPQPPLPFVPFVNGHYPPPPLVSPLQNQTDVLFTPCTHSSTCGFEWNDPYPSLYPTVNNNETPQPPPHFPLCQSPTLSTFYTQSATCSKAPQSQDTYHMYNHQRSLSPRSVAFAQSPAPIPFPAFPFPNY